MFIVKELGVNGEKILGNEKKIPHTTAVPSYWKDHQGLSVSLNLPCGTTLGKALNFFKRGLLFATYPLERQH